MKADNWRFEREKQLKLSLIKSRLAGNGCRIGKIDRKLFIVST